MANEGFDLSRSRISEDTLATFLSAPLVNDVTSVPGIGPAAANRLREDDVTTTIQLLGVFLRMRGDTITPRQHLDAMWYYLQGVGISHHRSGIVQCVAEKCNILIPGIYDERDMESSGDEYESLN